MAFVGGAYRPIRLVNGSISFFCKGNDAEQEPVRSEPDKDAVTKAVNPSASGGQRSGPSVWIILDGVGGKHQQTVISVVIHELISWLRFNDGTGQTRRKPSAAGRIQA